MMSNLMFFNFNQFLPLNQFHKNVITNISYCNFKYQMEPPKIAKYTACQY